MSGCVAVSANDRGTRECKALFWSYDVDNPLTLISQSKVGESKGFDIVLERQALCS